MSQIEFENEFPKNATTALPVFYRTYSRRTEDDKRETFEEVIERSIKGLREVGNLTEEELSLIRTTYLNLQALPSGRWMWIGGTEWIKNPKNYLGAYNCSSLNVDETKMFPLTMNALMCGTGMGSVLNVESLPPIKNRIELTFIDTPPESTCQYIDELFNPDSNIFRDCTSDLSSNNEFYLSVHDSRQGWNEAFHALIKLANDEITHYCPESPCDIVKFYLGNVRPDGTPIKGFGGTANSKGLKRFYTRVVEILNGAVGRQLTSVECCLLIDEAALAVVAGNIRRSACLKQSKKDDLEFAVAKENLWQENEHGEWVVDPTRDALRMSNFTRVFHSKPTLEECTSAVYKQYYSGEGAIQWAGEAVARSNADLLDTKEKKDKFLDLYDVSKEKAEQYLRVLLAETVEIVN